ncbi:MAG: hypothetical protein ACM3JJ_11260 [Hyphomicrobiales bacterium]
MHLSDIMAHAGLALYAEIAMVLFLLVFVVVVVRIFRARKSDVERQARLPLEDDEPPVRETKDD